MSGRRRTVYLVLCLFSCAAFENICLRYAFNLEYRRKLCLRRVRWGVWTKLGFYCCRGRTWMQRTRYDNDLLLHRVGLNPTLCWQHSLLYLVSIHRRDLAVFIMRLWVATTRLCDCFWTTEPIHSLRTKYVTTSIICRVESCSNFSSLLFFVHS